jgi:dCMP deaminase
MENKLQIFISSTFTDLTDERQAAVMAILGIGHIPAGMELFTAGDKSQLETIKKWIDDCDVYILILGGRYGSIELESQLSYTEVEYKYALESKKPLFAVELNGEWLEAKARIKSYESIYEFDNIENYKKFKKLVKSKMCAICKDQSGLQNEIIRSIMNIKTNHSLTGWIRALDTKGTTNKINILEKESKSLSVSAKDNEISENDIKTPKTGSNEKSNLQINNNSVVDVLFQKNKEFIIIGLTGRTGSGCSTVAKLLSSDEFIDKNKTFDLLNPTDNEGRKNAICYNYLAKNWEPAILIKVTHLILLLCLKDGFDKFIGNLRTWATDSYNTQIKQINNDLEELKNKNKDADDKENIEKSVKLGQEIVAKEKQKEKIEKEKRTREKIIDDVTKIIPDIELIKEMEPAARLVYTLLFNRTQSYRENPKEREIINNFLEGLGNCYTKFRAELNKLNSFVTTFQLFGNYIRFSTFFEQKEDESYYSITSLLHHIIQYYRNINYDDGKSTLIVINALRNPYEISYLRKKYSSFYAMSISADEEDRKHRLREDKEYDKATIKDFDETEYPSTKVSLSEKFIYQNIGECTQMSDIHIVNNNVYKDGTIVVDKDKGIKILEKRLIRYVSLMKHPGLVIPTHEERTMQFAFMAKSNSGCISRQVGAVITDNNFAIKTIGWNTVPEGQVP